MWWSMYLCSFIFLPSVVVAYKEIRTGLYSFMKDVHMVAEATQYIPLGHHAKIECPFDQYDGHKDMMEGIEFSVGPVGEPATVLNTAGEEHELMQERLHVYKNVIYLRGMTRKFNNFLIDCVAKSRENSSTTKYITLKSTVRLVAQDCSDENKGSERSFNKMNPCRYGSCHIKNNDGYELLECRCLPEYTGLYCDVLVAGALFYEFLYYCPVIFYISFPPIFFALHFLYEEKCKKKPRLFAIEKHIPQNNRSVNLRELYPTKFMTHREYTIIVSSLNSVEAEHSEEKSKEVNQSSQSKVSAVPHHPEKLKTREPKQDISTHSELSVEPEQQDKLKSEPKQAAPTNSELGETSFDFTKVSATVREEMRVVESSKKKLPLPMVYRQRNQKGQLKLPEETTQVETLILQGTPPSISLKECDSTIADSTQLTERSILKTQKTQ